MVRSKTLDDAVSGACEYLDVLCRQETLQDIFKKKIHLYPPDIEKELVTTKQRESKKWVRSEA